MGGDRVAGGILCKQSLVLKGTLLTVEATVDKVLQLGEVLGVEVLAVRVIIYIDIRNQSNLMDHQNRRDDCLTKAYSDRTQGWPCVAG